ncbi:MAG: protein methyltransferase HemK [Planctomycetota bacterium]
MATEAWTTRSLREWMRGFLQQKGVESAPACADLLLGHVAGCERMRLYMEPDRPWTADELATLRALVGRAAQHEPVQYLVGSWGFHAGDFEVGPCTLIPRPSTETIVDAALGWIAEQPSGSVSSAIDLGTGTGCIALSILRALRGRRRKDRVLARATLAEGDGTEAPASDRPGRTPDADPSPLPAFMLTDLVPEAIELARRNAARHGLDGHCSFRVGDAWSALEAGDGPFDLVVSNPPYISDAEFADLAPNVAQWEPRTALHGGPDGLDVIERIVRGAPSRMRPGALLLVELAASQERTALDLAQACGLRGATVLRDSDDLPRVLRAVVA